MSFALVLTAGILWGSMSIFIRGLEDFGLDPYQMMLIRSSFTSFILGIFIFFKDKSLLKFAVRDIWMFLGTGVLSLAFFTICYFNSILECGAAVSVVLLYTSPVFIIILSILFLGERFSKAKALALLSTVAGCVLVSGIVGGSANSVSGEGILIGLGSGLGYGLYSIFGSFALKKYKPLTVTFYTFLFSGITMIPFCDFEPLSSMVNDSLSIAYAVGLALFVTVLPYVFYTMGLKNLDAGKAGILATAEPLVGTLIGIFLWKEDFDFYRLMGIAMIFSSIGLCAKSKTRSFFKKHGFESKMIVDEILFDMRLAQPKAAGQDMFRTWMAPPQTNPKNEKVIVIDAGGTNFRSCLVSFDESGNASVSDFAKSSMPAIDREYSKKEFFEAVANRIDYLKDKSDKISFCFSYAMNITKDHDGIPNAFSKEIKAKEVLGVPVGKNLVEELERRGWNRITRITLLNDTVGALLAGASKGGNYSSYIGFILGTGMNGAFVDEENSFGDGRQIIVCENGKCNTIKLSDFDVAVDRKTDVPGQYPLEKCCSGAYLGKVGYEILMFAAREKIFSKQTNQALLELKEFSLIEMDDFLHGKPDCQLNAIFGNKGDRNLAFELLDGAVDRCAHYAASILCANLIASGAGKDASRPVCIVCNGTTFYKTYRLKERIEKYLHEYATKKHSLYYETVCIENDITVGTAVAAFA